MAIERQGPQDLIETTTTQDAEEDSQEKLKCPKPPKVKEAH